MFRKKGTGKPGAFFFALPEIRYLIGIKTIDMQTRRSFLKTGSLGLSATAAGLLVPTSLWAKPRGILGANNSLRLGLIGCNGMGFSNLSAFMQQPDVEVVALCDVDPSVLERRQAEVLASGRTKPEGYSDYRKLLERQDIDAVIIGTPDHWHCRQLLDAIDAGKDVYCEKPLGVAVTEGRAICAAVRRYGRVFQTGSQQRSEYGGKFRFACEMVRSGRIGDLKKIHVNVGGPSQDCYEPAQPTPPDVDWNMWLGPGPERPYNSILAANSYNHCSFWDYSGGQMTNWGAHGVDQIQWALGMSHTGPVEIWPTSEGPHGKFRMRYANGIVVRLEPGVVPRNWLATQVLSEAIATDPLTSVQGLELLRPEAGSEDPWNPNPK